MHDLFMFHEKNIHLDYYLTNNVKYRQKLKKIMILFITSILFIRSKNHLTTLIKRFYFIILCKLVVLRAVKFLVKT